jgi:hypothetical protein
LQEDVNKKQGEVERVKKLAEKLMEEYANDDTHNTRTQLERLTNRWARLLNR